MHKKKFMPLKEEMVEQGNFLFKYRSFLPIIILAVAIILYVQHMSKINDNLASYSIHQWELLCLLVSLLGLFIRILCVGFAHDNTSGRNTDEGQIADAVNSTGMYAMCRHPLYLGNFFMWLGLAMFTANAWFVVAFIFMYWVYYERIMFAEEEYLRGKFNATYENWASSTPAFIPAFSKWTKPKLSFSLKKVIRQEKAGILNLFFVIYLFKKMAWYFNGGDYIIHSFWVYALTASLAWYLVVKLLQKTTAIFEKDR